MKQRIIAIIILVLLIGFPIVGYWFFFVKNTSGIEIVIGKNMSATVRLSGTFSYKWLPLADKALQFEQKCEEKCLFSPIAPAKYRIEIMAENYATISDEVTLKNGKVEQRQYELMPVTEFVLSNIVPTPMSADEKQLRNDDIRKALGQHFGIIERDINGRLWAYEHRNASTYLGFFQENRFIEVLNFPLHFSHMSLDFYHNVFVLQTHDNATVLITLDRQNTLETRLPEGVKSVFFSQKAWYAVTEKETLIFQNGAWKNNIRFSHFADFDNRWRAGFIAKDAEKRLKLSNFDTEKGSVLLLLDRKNGEIFEVARGLDVTDFVVYQKAIFAKTPNGFYEIKIPE